MTSRTPLPNLKPNYSTGFNKSTVENANEIDYNNTNTNKAGINQSTAGGKNTNYTNESISENKVYPRAIPLENYSALFDTEYLHVPLGKSKYYKPPKEEPKDVKKEKGPYTALEERVKESKNKVEVADKTVNDLDRYFGADNDQDSNMAYYGDKMSDLEMRNKLHSAKIHELERELKNVRVENSRIKGQIVGPEANGGYNGMGGNLGNIPETYDPSKNYFTEQAQPDPYKTHEQPAAGGRRHYENEQHRIAHRAGGADEEPYWGFNKFYDPQYITAYRREHIPYYAKQEEREKQTQYADDYNYLHERQRREEEEWRRKREMEEYLMKDKPRTYEYTAPYQSLSPPRDINKYFHDSKFLDEKRPESKPDEFYFKEDAYKPLHQRTGVSTYERAYESPRYFGLADADPGGLYILRFEDSGYEDARVAFRSLQTVLKSYDGRMLGIARKHNVFDIEGDANWRVSRNRQHRQQGRMHFNEVEDAIAVLWFPRIDKAKKFYENTYKNRFHDINFPTPGSYEAHFVHLLARPIHRQLDTYLVIELLNVKHYSPEQLQRFETETREAVMQKMPSCIPFIAATTQGHQTLRNGSSSLFRDKTSKVFISIFTSMNELAFLWESGTIQMKMQEFNLKRPNNVWAFALRDWQE